MDGMDSRGSMLTGMSSVLETFPSMIDGFKLGPLDPNSTLLVLTSNHAEDEINKLLNKLLLLYFVQL